METVAQLRAECNSEIAHAPARLRGRRARAKASNFPDYLDGINGNLATARRFRDLVNAFLVDLGGVDACSEIKLGLVRRLASATIQSEILEAKVINGAEVDVATLCQLASTILRLSARLGTERVPKLAHQEDYETKLQRLNAAAPVVWEKPEESEG